MATQFYWLLIFDLKFIVVTLEIIVSISLGILAPPFAVALVEKSVCSLLSGLEKAVGCMQVAK